MRKSILSRLLGRPNIKIKNRGVQMRPVKVMTGGLKSSSGLHGTSGLAWRCISNDFGS